MRVLAAAVAFAVACDALPFDVATSEEAVSCPDVCKVRVSAAWELLQVIRSDGMVLARSYHNTGAWEELKKGEVTMGLAACTATADMGKWCFTKDAQYTYTLKSSVVDTTNVDVQKHQAARFFQQATFGASEAEIETLRATIASSGLSAGRLSWFDTQVALEASTARPYVRKRFNARFSSTMGGTFYQPADVGSRWHRYAFSMRDEGKIMQISKISGSGADFKGTVKVSTNVLPLNNPDLDDKGDMLTLTEVAGSEWETLRNDFATFQVCKVDEGTEEEGSVMKLATPNKCKGNNANDQSTAPNVLISFADSATVCPNSGSALDSSMCLATSKLSYGRMKLAALARGSMPTHTLVMQAFSWDWLVANQAYRFPENLRIVSPAVADLDKIYFLRVENTDAYYRYDARQKLLANTEESPTAAVAADVNPGSTYCPAVKVDVMNPNQACQNSATAAQTSDCSGNAQASCGQRGEVANDPNLGNRYQFAIREDQKDKTSMPRELDYYIGSYDGKMQPFHNFAMSATDQLRQRVTWALFQKVPISEDLGATRLVESWAQYMDIFATHAFGNYRDILQEVSASPMMGLYLSFSGNKAYAADSRLPDQNYAREVMQLFSIGMTKLNMDGTHVLDDQGQSVPTYVNKDIVTFARSWTGFYRGGKRGNIESFYSSQELDPMPIRGADRDAFPKTDLTGGYIGDGYPLCEDLPPQHFLKKGAKYVYSGTSSVEGADYDLRTSKDNFQHQTWAHDDGVDIVVLGDNAARCYANTHCGNPDNTVDAKIEIDVVGDPGDPASDGSKGQATEVYIRGERPDGTVEVWKTYRVSKLFDTAKSGGNGRPARVIIQPHRENKMNMMWYANTVTHLNDIFPDGTTLTFHNVPEGSDAPPSQSQYTPDASSELYEKLCGSSQGACTFPRAITLDSTLSCNDDVCSGLQDLTTVKVVEGGVTHYYTYVPTPCTKLALFEGQVITRRNKPGFDRQCGNPALPSAGVMCCLKDQDTEEFTVAKSFYKPPFCNTLGERMTHHEALLRCADLGQDAELCDGSMTTSNSMDYTQTCGSRQYTWIKDTCTMKVQVKAGGLLALVVDEDDTGRYVEGTLNDFYPVWDPLTGDGAGSTEPNYPEPDKTGQTPGTSVCTVYEQDGAKSLTCSVTIEDTAVFADPDSLDQVISQGKEQVEAMLSIGAVDPALNSDTYSLLAGTSSTADVTRYVKDGSWAKDAIIGVKQAEPRGGGYKYYMNRRSTVWINKNPSANSWAYSFRNLPSFMRLVGEGTASGTGGAQVNFAAVRDTWAAAAETTAVLDHLLYHQSTAPFLARHIIQRMVTSNPSPAYIERVATAFVQGTYGEGNAARGSGEYGCLKATIAAVLLDAEATSSVLEADPSFGHVHEPFLKVFRVFRSLQFASNAGQELLLNDLQDKIGQDPFLAPSVFGFYLPDYIPKGPLAQAHLFSPESELLVAPPLFGMLNGLSALVRMGLSHCDDGFGLSKIGLSQKSRQNCLPDWTMGWSSGETTSDWTADKSASAGRIVDKLDVLLTSGRLSADSKQIIVDAVTAVVDPARTLEEATTYALELILTTAEFHSTGFSLPAPSVTPPPPPPPSYDTFSLSDYKVVVVVLKKGGADSWNYLIPGQSNYCRGTLSYDEYETRRGNAAVPMELLDPSGGTSMEITLPGVSAVPGNNAPQPCSRFYLHPNFTNVRDAYNAGDAAFFANIGNLAEPITKATLKEKKNFLPLNLFSHDQQRRQSQTLDPLTRVNVNGILGKMADAVADSKKTDIFGFDQYHKMVEADTAVATVLDKKRGTKVLRGVLNAAGEDANAPVNQLVEENPGTRSHFAATYCKSLRHSLSTTSEMSDKLDAAEADWKNARTAAGTTPFESGKVSAQFSVLSQVVNLRKVSGANGRESHRDVFVVNAGGFDTHNTHTPPESLKDIDNAIGSFRAEMMRQGLWDDTVVVTVSEFGRALPPNAAGTDHGWGGHYMAVGGKVKKTILGQYPASLTIENEMDNGHGTMIPYRGWDTMWAPIMDWFGVPSDKHEEVLPYIRKWPEFVSTSVDLKGTLFES